jgi:hypothetical protein
MSFDFSVLYFHEKFPVQKFQMTLTTLSFLSLLLGFASLTPTVMA